MVSQQIIDIIIKAEDMASKQTEKVKDKFKGLGDTSKNAMTNASKATYKFNTDLLKVNNSFGVVGSGAAQASNLLGQMKLDPNFGSTMDRAKLSVSEMGYSLDSTKGKFMVLKTASSMAWDNIKSKVNSTGQSIKSKIGGALDKIRNKLKNVSNGFRNLSAGAKNAGGGLGFLGNAASMAAGMIGYDLLNSVMESTRASLNARQSIQAFGSRLNMSGSEVSDFQSQLDGLQNSFRKVDMDVVGQQAMDMAYRLQLPKDSLSQLTETSAIFTDAMARNGRSAEDATLALADAMDGEFRRLKEIGISQQDLMDNGWDGDINNKTGLLDAMNKSLKDQHYDVLAKSVDNLDDAWRALSVTLGNLVESILVPLTPMIVGFIDMIAGFVDAFKNMPDWAKIALGIGAIGLAFGLLASAAAAAEMTIGAFVVSLMPEFIASLFAAAGGLGAVSVAGAPLWLIVGAIAAVAIAAFEVGKAFGWWHDVGSMIDAISAGVQRLWRMFMNNKQVKQFIKELGDAWKWVSDSLKPVVDWAHKVWDDLFPDSAEGKFDIVRSIAEAFGWVARRIAHLVGAAKSAWSSFMGFINYLATTGGIIGVVRDALKGIVCILLGCSPGIVPALEKVQEVFTTVWNAIAGFIGGVISTIVSAIQPIISILSQIANFYLSAFMYAWQTVIMVFNIVSSAINRIISVFNLFLSGQINLQTMIIMIWNTLKSMFVAVFNTIISRVTSFASKMVTKALAMARQFVSNIVNHVKQLPGKVYSLLLVVVGIIKTAIQAWITAAVSKVTDLISKITSPFSGVAGKITSALSGVASALLSPFKTAWEWIKPYYDKIKGALDILPGGAGGELAAGGMPDEIKPTAPVVSSGSQELTVKGELGFNVNVSGLPAGVDSRQVEDIFNTLVNDKDFKANVMREIATNSVFQKYDRKEKLRLTGKVNRARGV